MGFGLGFRAGVSPPRWVENPSKSQTREEDGLSASAIREKAWPNQKAAARQGVGRRVSSWDLTSVLGVVPMGFVSGFALGSRLRDGWKTPSRTISSMGGYPVADQKDAGNAGFFGQICPRKAVKPSFLSLSSPNIAETAVLCGQATAKQRVFGHLLERWLCKRDTQYGG